MVFRFDIIQSTFLTLWSRLIWSGDGDGDGGTGQDSVRFHFFSVFLLGMGWKSVVL